MLTRLEITGFKSFARKTTLSFSARATAIVGPNGSGKSNVAEAFRFALGEQSMKSMRGKRSEDLIFSGSHSAQRANRAAVTIYFDNKEKVGTRLFPKLDFDEVSIERAVFRDGTGEYLINGTKVRLRDVQELLAAANIGDTGHHIISQGEADRILSAHPRERRAMLEDALGLKAFEFRKQEAVRKLERTEQNVKEVEALRREIAPHLKFLKRQVERLERAQALVEELIAACQTYLPREEAYVANERERLAKEKRRVQEQHEQASAGLAAFEEKSRRDSEGIRHAERVRSAEREQERILRERGELARELGRVEGSLEGSRRRAAHDARGEGEVAIPREDLRELVEETRRQADVDEGAEPQRLFAAIRAIRGLVSAFHDRYAKVESDYLLAEEQRVNKLEQERAQLVEKDAALARAYDEAKVSLAKAREAAIAHEETDREERQGLLALAERKGEAESALAALAAEERSLSLLEQELERDKREALALAGSRAVSYAPVIDMPEEPRTAQEERKRTLERLKIRVEEAGGGSDEVKKEYTEAVAREEFLGRELEDLARSSAGLKELIASIETELSETFANGLGKVNASFGEFFALMFGGGTAKLVLEEVERDEEDEETLEDDAPVSRPKAGIEVSIALPKKRVQSLMQLSGGERALTSIALIFAMSQVNPPPFLILDETDAALDEANSRRYGDMVDLLAEKSQLIVITHNRETMSRAGVLYGVTMAGDGISKLLSIQFEEAAQVAK